MTPSPSTIGLALLVAAALPPTQASAAPVVPDHVLDDPTPSRNWSGGDGFGGAVALDGELALVGAPLDDTRGGDVGQAHLFDAATGVLLRTLDDPTPDPEAFDGDYDGDLFGWSVAVGGGRALVGAPGDDTRGERVGQAHLFDATGALLRTLDNPSPRGEDGFGVSVALDGDRALVGAPNAWGGSGAGRTHLFDAATGALLRTLDDPADRSVPHPVSSDKPNTQFTEFGAAVALDGDRALVGAPYAGTAGRFNQDELRQAARSEAHGARLRPPEASRTRSGTAELQIRVAILNRFTAIGIPLTPPAS